MDTNNNIIHDVIPISLDDYNLSDFSVFPKIFELFSVSDDDIEKSFGNTGIIIDMKFPKSSQKARDLFCVFIVLHQLRNLLDETLRAKTYDMIYQGYSEENLVFINWIMNTIIVKPEYSYYKRHIRDTLEWNLQRTNSNLILDNSTEFNNIVEPPDIAEPPNILRLRYAGIDQTFSGGSKHKRKSRKSKKSIRTQKKRKINKKTKKHRIIKRNKQNITLRF
jgi:hypothetical protein